MVEEEKFGGSRPTLTTLQPDLLDNQAYGVCSVASSELLGLGRTF